MRTRLNGTDLFDLYDSVNVVQSNARKLNATTLRIQARGFIVGPFLTLKVTQVTQQLLRAQISPAFSVQKSKHDFLGQLVKVLLNMVIS